MRRLRFGIAAIVFLVTFLFAPVSRADTTQPNSAVPGTLNYVEGSVSLGSEALNAKSIGSADLQQDQSLTTQTGKAEILLTPGVFLRLGDNTSVKMLSPNLTDTRVQINQGHAMIEVAEIHPENDIRVLANGTTTRLFKTGLYDFNLQQGEFRVFDGEASFEGSQEVKVKGGRQVALNASASLKAQKFNKKDFEEDDLYRWSSLRSAYLAEANVNGAGLYANDGWGPWGPGWWGAGWYWNPWFSAYTFIPGDGIFYSPFGWGFYSPWCVYQAPFYGYWAAPGYRPYYRSFSTDVRNWGPGNHYVGGANYAGGVYRGPGGAGGFRSGPAIGTQGGFGRTGGSPGEFRGGGFNGGGFHGGVGFHGGGGFHGR